VEAREAVPRKDQDMHQAFQPSAMELGFAVGSMTCQVGLPLPLRQQSTGGFARSSADLRRLALDAGVRDPTAEQAVSSLLSGFADPNSMSGAQRILAGANAIKDHLSAGREPSGPAAFRVGFAIGYSLEHAAVVSRAKPTDDQARMAGGVLGQFRASLPADLATASLPADLAAAVRRTETDLRSADDFRQLVAACLAVTDLAGRYRARS
jgi:hypothetical protein